MDTFNAPATAGNTRLTRLIARCKSVLLNDNAAFIPALLMSLLLILVVWVMYSKGYSQREYTAADGLKHPHGTVTDEDDTLGIGAQTKTVVLPPEPPPRGANAVAVKAGVQPIAPVPVAPNIQVPTPVAASTEAPVIALPPTTSTVVKAASPAAAMAQSTATAAYAATFKQGCEALISTKAAIQFEPRTNYLNTASKRSLAPLLACFKGHKVSISGHTDSIGTPERKAEVSQLRADAVSEYLISQGIPAAQLVARGMSDRKPLADNETPEGRAKNRRIEFVIESITQ